VQGDPSQLKNALLNLAINARDAMPEGGKLRIALSEKVVAADGAPPATGMGPGEWVCLTVSDTGTGMTEEVKGRIFEPFFTTKERGQGTGLGLSQVYGIVKQHRGFIDLQTEPGVGTTFHVYLPVFEAGETEEVEEDSSVAYGRGETILLVEDHESLAEAGRQILEAQGYRTLAAINGRQALEMLDGIGVDLVITDVVMPVMGGKALMLALSETHPDLPVLAVTGYTLEEEIEKLREAGFSDVLHKPFDASALARAVRRALDMG
jgi:CheY-like chemotaxis protein